MFSEGFIQHELSQTYHDFIHTRVGVAALCINLFYIKNLTINFNMMPNFEEELFDSTLSKTRYSSIHDYINKSKMYRNYVLATETEIITLTAILGITIYSYSLTPTFVGWARYGTQELYGIPCDTNTPALYLKHVGTNHF